MKKRELVTIQCVNDVSPIIGTDELDLVHVLGWQCVAKKGQFALGDACVYFEIDSFLPVCEQFEFLRDTSYAVSPLMGEGFRLRTQKFYGQISQGLVLPMSILPEPEREYFLGEDVTDVLGVRKWKEESAVSYGTVLANLPDEIPRAEEARIQSHPALLLDFIFSATPEYYVTTKMDGISVTMYSKSGHFGVCGKNIEYADDGKCAMWNFAHERRIFEKMVDKGLQDIAIQGEFCGPEIRKNILKLDKPEWYVFTIYDLKLHKRLSLNEMQEACEMLDLQMVPVEEVKDSFAYDSIDALLERAKGKYPSGTNKEGIVIRPVVPVHSRIIEEPLSVEVQNNDYLLDEQ